MDDLEKRVAALEHGQKRWRLFAFVLAAAMAAMAAAPPNIQDVVRTRRLEVVSPDGKPVVIAQYQHDEAGLTLLDGETTHSRVDLYANPDEGGVRVRSSMPDIKTFCETRLIADGKNGPAIIAGTKEDTVFKTRRANQ